MPRAPCRRQPRTTNQGPRARLRRGLGNRCIEWTNFPSRRPDGVFLPDVTGIVRLDSYERPIMYRMQGISLAPDEQDVRLFAGPVRWYTDEPNLLWLNDRWGYEEGSLDLDTLRFHTRVHVLHPESPGRK